MKKSLWILMAALLPIFAFNDIDLDGVPDTLDKCPDTPITDLVGPDGCSIKSVMTENHFDIVTGLAYSQYNYRLNSEIDTLTASLQADWFHGNWAAQIYTSYYNSDSQTDDIDGMNDTTLTGYYTFCNVTPRLDVQVGAGVILPTYDAQLGNNNTDYLGTLNLNYSWENANLFGGYTFTYIGDDDVSYTDMNGNTQTIRYQNTNAFSLGAGYSWTTKIYTSLSYYQSDSIYQDVEDIKNVTLYGYYAIDAHWFITGSYACGLSDATGDHYYSLRLGYYF